MRRTSHGFRLATAVACLSMTVVAQGPEEFRIGRTASSIVIQVGRAGLLAFAGRACGQSALCWREGGAA